MPKEVKITSESKTRRRPAGERPEAAPAREAAAEPFARARDAADRAADELAREVVETAEIAEQDAEAFAYEIQDEARRAAEQGRSAVEDAMRRASAAAEAQARLHAAVLDGWRTTFAELGAEMRRAVADGEQYAERLAQVRTAPDFVALQAEFAGRRAERTVRLQARLAELWSEAARRGFGAAA